MRTTKAQISLRSLISLFVLRCLDIIPLLAESKISGLKLVSEAGQTGLSRTWSKTPETGFLVTKHKYNTTQAES